ncbi:hypothetical protein [Arsenophonus endosymbiont of Aleurodicus dispersus]|nr:hypothetical protein [Arsenophonus endosymbiont of Aleurodicus dispersus]
MLFYVSSLTLLFNNNCSNDAKGDDAQEKSKHINQIDNNTDQVA